MYWLPFWRYTFFEYILNNTKKWRHSEVDMVDHKNTHNKATLDNMYQSSQSGHMNSSHAQKFLERGF